MDIKKKSFEDIEKDIEINSAKDTEKDVEINSAKDTEKDVETDDDKESMKDIFREEEHIAEENAAEENIEEDDELGELDDNEPDPLPKKKSYVVVAEAEPPEDKSSGYKTVQEIHGADRMTSSMMTKFELTELLGIIQQFITQSVIPIPHNSKNKSIKQIAWDMINERKMRFTLHRPVNILDDEGREILREEIWTNDDHMSIPPL